MRKLILVLFMFGLNAFAEPLVFESVLKESKIEFVADIKITEVVSHFEEFKVTAKLDKPDPLTAKIEAYVETKSIESGISRRDKHLRGSDFFWVHKFPKATFTSEKVTKGEKKDTFLVEGSLKIRDQTKKVKVPLTMVEEEVEGVKHYRFKGEWSVNRRDFGITYDSGWFFIPTILDEIVIRIDVLLKKME